MSRPTTEPRVNFWKHVAKGKGCWEWTGGCLPPPRFPYGKFTIKGKNYSAHRFAWTLTNGPIPDGKWVLHKCDNPKCVRPDHLFLGNNSDNQRDSSRKKRHVNSKKTHCKNGHAYAGKNLIVRSDGNRLCRECARIRDAKRRSRPPFYFLSAECGEEDFRGDLTSPCSDH